MKKHFRKQRAVAAAVCAMLAAFAGCQKAPRPGAEEAKRELATPKSADLPKTSTPASTASDQRRDRQTTPFRSSEDFASNAAKLREEALLHLEPTVLRPIDARPPSAGRYPWRKAIVTNVFAIGEKLPGKGKAARQASAWNPNWEMDFGGYDDPDPTARRNSISVKFQPQQNPFYIALPYNDVTGGTTKPEARVVIPWFSQTFEREGESVCQDRWVEVRNGHGKSCYAQWSDCGPARTDHFQYVFGSERPKANAIKGAGLSVSPAVRDFLGLADVDVTEWRFVEFRDIPTGPWSKWGNNNPFVQMKYARPDREVGPAPVPARVTR